MEMLLRIIQSEVKRLDAMTGLNATEEVDVKFDDSSKFYGRYTVSAGRKTFVFSRYYFFPEEVMIMIVRHEYAHYMCHSIYRCMDHSFLYEKCAKHIGCNDRVVYAFLAKNGIPPPYTQIQGTQNILSTT